MRFSLHLSLNKCLLSAATLATAIYGSDALAMVFNPDPLGTGTVTYSAYADNPNSDVAIINLAENLGNDPIRMYEWVRNNVRTELYWGGHRGAYLTFLERAGNDVDQCALLGALFRASGYTPTYYMESTSIPRTASGTNSVGVYEWLNVSDDSSALNVIGGQHGPTFSGDRMYFTYMCMTINIPGRGLVKFSPAIKPHAIGRKPNLDTLTGYTLTNTITAAGATTSGAYSPAINSSNLRSYLTGLLTQASSAVHSSINLNDLSGTELARVPTIVPELVTQSAPTATSYPDGLDFNMAGGLPMTGIPVTYIGRLKFRIGTQSHWFECSELMGKPLVCEFDGAGAAIMRLGGVEIVRETAGGPTNTIDLEFGYEFPSSLFGGSPEFHSQTFASRRQNAAAFCYGFGALSNRLTKTTADIAAKEAISSTNVTNSDRLELIGEQYLSQTHELEFLLSASRDYHFEGNPNTALIYFDPNTGTPIVTEAGGYGQSWRPRTTSTSSLDYAMSGASYMHRSALEGCAIEQMSGQRSFGGTSLYDYAMTLGRGAYLISSRSQLDQLRNQNSLQNFNDATLGPGSVATIESDLTHTGWQILVLDNSAISYGSTHFASYYRIPPGGGAGPVISGYNGGVSSGALGTNSVKNPFEFNDTVPTLTPLTLSLNLSHDPVDLTTGAFYKSDVDLAIGSAEPNGLRLERNYNSARRISDPVGLGRGWTHNFALRVVMRHPVEIDALRVGVDEVLPAMIAARVAQDILASESSARAWLIASTAASWSVDQMLNSRAAVSLGTRTVEFVKRPDGSFAAPGNLAASLAKQGDGSFDLTFRNSNAIHFRASDGKFTSITDPYGNTLTATYDTSNRLTTVTDSYARTLTFSYNGSGRLYQVDDSTGRSVKYGRDASNNFTFTDAENQTQTYVTDSDYLVTRIVDARNRTVVENDYDFWKRVYQQRSFGDATKQYKVWIAPGIGAEVDPLGNAEWTYFDARGRQIYKLDRVGRLTNSQYDGVDRVTKIVAPAPTWTASSPVFATSTYTYDPTHALAGETNPAGDTRTITNDAQGRPTTVRNFEGKSTTIAYNDFQKPGAPAGTIVYTTDVTSTTLPGSIVSTSSYDSRGRLLTSHPAAYASGEVLSYGYDSNGNINSVTYPGTTSNVDTLTSNARGDITQIVDRRGATTSYTYNKRRQQTSTTQWIGTTQLTSQTFYDAAGDIDYTLDASGRKTDYDYNALGHLSTIARGAIGSQVTVLTNTYNSRELLSQTSDALSNSATFSYDAAQRCTDVYDALSLRTQQSYDPAGNPTTVTTPLNFSSTTTYDSRGLKQAWKDAESNLVDYTYDKDGRMTVLANRITPGKTFTWTYDDTARTVTSKTPLLKTTVETRNARGLLSSIQLPSGATTTFDSFDSEGRVTQKTDGVGTTTYTYWPNGLLKEVTEGGHTTYRGYDEINRLNEYRDGFGNTLTYEYLASGELWKLHYPGGRVVTYGYDSFGRLKTVTDWSTPPRTTTYTYDDANRLTRIDRPNGTYRTQDYDAANRLRYIKEFKSNGAYIFFLELQYDNDGRITYSFLNPKPATFTLPQDSLIYDDDNRIATWNSQTVTHDANGNMTSGPLPNRSFGTYTYDARNRLTSAGGSSYTYSPDGLRVQITGTGAATFAVDPNAALPRILTRTKGGVTTYYVYGLELLYEDTNGAIATYHSNQVGSTLAITDGSQNVTDRIGYAPFGTVTERTGTTDTLFLFNGSLGVTTESNGLLYMRARFYNPVLMRFCNADPIKFGGGLNWYAFGNDNPILSADPSGEFVPLVVILGGAIVGALLTPNYANAPGPRDPIYQPHWTDVAGNAIGGAIGSTVVHVGFNGFTPMGRVGGSTSAATSRVSDLAAQAPQIVTERFQTINVTQTVEGPTIISANGTKGMLATQVAAKQTGEVVAPAMGAHAEVAGLTTTFNSGLTPLAGAVSRPICASCQSFIRIAGGELTSPTTYVFPSAFSSDLALGQSFGSMAGASSLSLISTSLRK